MNKFPKLQQPEGSILCGAYCVVASLSALGIIPFSETKRLKKFDIASMSFCGETVQFNPHDSLYDLVNKVYQVTGIINEDNPSQFISESGLNSVVAMAYVLEEFGLKTDLIVRDEWTYGSLSHQNSHELALLESLSIPVVISDEPSLVESNHVLIVSVVADFGSHYVATSSNKVWFDSAKGVNTAFWGCITEWTATQKSRVGYDWFGVALRVWDKQDT
ncbi:hypothetical protein MHO82_23105 [Vibrio sp. Of7-15]|uniref:hypothetical protein n=1 Tax=Vibrio sp. Of7-15 TaxID=2724879 RepID=UPI001EF227B7|nr:hypothetical protein [Vibrio sp. Of7-15]MCG7499759.1 hypothetical protein [Vibrio sp. Of7-15]